MIDAEMQRMGVPNPSYLPTSNYKLSSQPGVNHPAEPTDSNLLEHK
jgi:hypothetical protein